MKKLLFGITLSTVILLMTTPAAADVITTNSGNSHIAGWTHTDWRVHDFGQDTIEAFILEDSGAGPFRNDGLTNSTSDWSSRLISPTYSLAAGDLPGEQYFDIEFAGDINSTLTMAMVAWQGGVFATYVGGLRWLHLGNNEWTFDYDSTDGGYISEDEARSYNRQNPVPVPASILLLCSGLIGLEGFRRKYK